MLLFTILANVIIQTNSCLIASLQVLKIDSIEELPVLGHLRQQFYPLTHPLIINLCG